MSDESAPEAEYLRFILTIEARWLATTLLLRTLIRYTTGLDRTRVAAMFDDASDAIDATQEAGANPQIAAMARELINDLGALVASDAGARRGSGAS